MEKLIKKILSVLYQRAWRVSIGRAFTDSHLHAPPKEGLFCFGEFREKLVCCLLGTNVGNMIRFVCGL
jgi:hypothetical protein